MATTRPEWPAKNHVLLRLRQHPLTLGNQKSARPIVTIDGVERTLDWGESVLPYWDDRPVTILVEVPAHAVRAFRTRIGRAQLAMAPGPGRSLEYAAPPNGYAGGVIGPIGRVRAKGTAAAIILVAINTVLLTATAAAVLLGVIIAIGAVTGGL